MTPLICVRCRTQPVLRIVLGIRGLCAGCTEALEKWLKRNPTPCEYCGMRDHLEALDGPCSWREET